MIDPIAESVPVAEAQPALPAVDVGADEQAIPTAADQEALLAKLRELGGHAGNVTLSNAIGWEPEKYWKVRGALLEAGAIKKGRGKGGSVSIVEAPTDQEMVPQEPTAVSERPKESDLYAGAHKSISETWWREENYDAALAEITAAQGSKQTGGKWTRPDISVAATKSYVYFPETVFDIVTFEIKPKDQVNVLGVFEAIAHREFGTRAYVIFEGSTATLEGGSEWERIVDVANRYGIGVLTAEKMDDFRTWEEITEAKRVTSDPGNIDKFIRTSMSEAARTQIIKWQK